MRCSPVTALGSSGSLARPEIKRRAGLCHDRGKEADRATPTTVLKTERETPSSLVSSVELVYPYGAPFTTAKPGATTTPNGRLGSDGSGVERVRRSTTTEELERIDLDRPSSWTG